MEKQRIAKHHLTDCVDIFLKAYNSAPWNCHWTMEKASQYLSELIDSNGFIGFILYENEKAIGAVLAHSKTWWTHNQLMVDEFFIAPEFQAKGYGKKLMRFCDEYAQENEIELMVLMTNKYLPAYRFYENLGYITADQYTFMFKQL
ncbi:GNAT family N-acetyltransferase [Mucilaginibacter sp. FT3.2]|uniref:GNAT family N-acetyltransferase n=1 Tax=Mucilaginibacter sp. FT3.2 TaxID=2723090 RepID=UPI00161352F6|nr:GNAT family N-acetyltransferase [Mucilaginibacter sp. FT3.2]MBB6234172.1 GNAT superfamily N-acetyltransferase [Mucilaginibacter sp. FT3.2]